MILCCRFQMRFRFLKVQLGKVVVISHLYDFSSENFLITLKHRQFRDCLINCRSVEYRSPLFWLWWEFPYLKQHDVVYYYFFLIFKNSNFFAKAGRENFDGISSNINIKIELVEGRQFASKFNDVSHNSDHFLFGFFFSDFFSLLWGELSLFSNSISES